MSKMLALRGKAREQAGFTLIEMLIVVAIIAILVAVSIPMMNGALEDSRLSTDMANMRSAKAWAQMDFMKGSEASVFKAANKDATSGKYVGYYDAAVGDCKAAKTGITPYGKTKATHDGAGITSDGTTSVAAENKIIKVAIDPTGNATTPPGTATITWE